ncbi:MAG: ABC transporter transmembrane domain-containing protein, partial [Verrucomicrobiota bacterium]
MKEPTPSTAEQGNGPTTSADRQLAREVWQRIRPWRGRLFLSLGLLVISVPFINLHPLVWGIVADDLVKGTLSPSSLGFWLAVMLGTYLIGLALNAVHSFLLEKTGQAFVRDIRADLFRKFQDQSLAYH